MNFVLAEAQLDGLKNFRLDMEGHIKSQAVSIEEKWDDAFTQAQDDPQYPWIEDAAADEYQSVAYGYTDALHTSVLMASYALLEHHLRKICHLIQARAKPKKTLRKFGKGGVSYLQAMSGYLQQFGCSPLEDLDSWDKVDRLRDLRNKFAHNGGEIPIEDMTQWQDIGKMDEFINTAVIRPSEEYCTQSIDDCKDFLRQVNGAFSELS